MRFDVSAVVHTLGALAIGWLLVRLVKGRTADFQGADWAALFIPTLAYLIFSGALTEFKAVGFEAKLQSRVQAAIPMRIIGSSQIIGGAAPSADLRLETAFGRAQHIIAVRTSDWENLTKPQHESKAVAVAVSIYQSILAGSFVGLVVLDEQQKPIGIFEASYFLDLLRIPLDRLAVSAEHESNVLTKEKVRSRIFETNIWLVLQHPKLRAREDGNKEFVPYDISKRDAFVRMVEKRVEVLPVTDPGGRFMGVLSKRSLADQIVLDLIETTKMN
jgi:CBS domain-containing protein